VAFAASTPGPNSVPVPLQSSAAARPTSSPGVIANAPAFDASPGWARVAGAAQVWTEPTRGVARATLPVGSRLEILGSGAGGKLFVRYPGDGIASAPGRGWVEPRFLSRIAAPTEEELPWAYPATTEPGTIRLPVPYLSQLDGTSWAEANCGPTALGMAMATFGIKKSSADLRAETLDEQGMWGDSAGTLLDALARVAQDNNLVAVEMYDGDAFKHWTTDEIRDQLLQGRPVIVQVRFRGLPGREDRPYWGDHYIVLTGVAGDSFLYNDPIDSDGIGFDRSMSKARLQDAMRASDRRYTQAAFALAKP
jgi:hypothetical protein